MRQKYDFTGIVRRTVIDKISMVIRADSEDEAFLKARLLLDVFPGPAFDKDVIHSRVDDRETQSIELLALKHTPKSPSTPEKTAA